MVFDNKKGQVTVIIIIAFLLVVALGFFIYFNADTVQTQLDKSISDPVLEEVSADFKPINSYVENCIKDVGEDAIHLVAENGGYVSVTSPLYAPDFSYDPIKPYLSDLVSFSGSDSSYLVPYWNYVVGEPRFGDLEYQPIAPSKSLMEQEISRYIQFNLFDCLAPGFRDFNSTYDIKISSFPNVTTTITPKDVRFLVDMDLDLTYGSIDKRISQFYAKSYLPLYSLYEKSLDILEFEMKNQYFENVLMDVIVSDASLNSDHFAPLFAAGSGYNYVYWNVYNLESKFKESLISFVNSVQVPFTYNSEPIVFDDSSGFQQSMYNKLIYPVFGDENNDNLEVSFIYANQGIYFNVNPNKNGILSPKVVKGDTGYDFLPVTNDLTYRFFYDFTFPVIVKVTDHSNPSNPLSMVFAMEINVLRNQNLPEIKKGNDVLVVPKVDVKLDAEVPILKDDGSYSYGAFKNRNVVTACNDEFLDSGVIQLKLVDSLTGEGIEHASVSFKCGSYSSCNEHETILSEDGSYAYTRFRVPMCMNGLIEIKKMGYETLNIPFTPEYGVDHDFGFLKMNRVYEVPVRVEKYVLFDKYHQCLSESDIKNMFVKGGNIYANMVATNPIYSTQSLIASKIAKKYGFSILPNGACSSESKNYMKNYAFFHAISGDKVSEFGNYELLGPINLTDGDQVILNFEKNVNSDFEDNLPSTIILTSVPNESNSKLSMNKIKVSMGRFNLDAMYMDGAGIEIPAKCKKIDEDFLQDVIIDDTYVPSEPIFMKPALWGGSNLNGSESIFVTRDVLKNISDYELVIKVLRMPEPTNYECLDAMGYMGDKRYNFYKKFRSYLRPEFVKLSKS